MFDIKELTTAEISVFTGKAALKSMQNDHTFLLDLLVRESIQNSSDAALKDDPVFFVCYNFGKFNNKDLSGYFTSIEEKLNERFADKECSFIEIRDSKTAGLNGKTLKSECTNDTKSNYLRLIFDMGKGQDQMNAGGNWGYGKTVFYRVGNGIVIYYSRIKGDNGQYESRLILTLIENEEKEDALLRKPRNNSAGRAWWGEAKSGSDDIYPIIDENIINDFLKVFGIRPFEDEETGTSIIIPYIDEKALMEEAKTGFKADETVISRCSFLNSVTAYLKYAVQKWYAPIINNYELKSYDRKFINVYVNDELVGRDEMYPIFKLVQELYTTAYAALSKKTRRSRYQIIYRDSICKYKRSTQKCGIIAFVKIKIEDLYGDELLLPPNVYMNVADDEYNGMVSLYTRDLGMILNYDEKWIKDYAILPEELLLTIFVPDTKAELTAGNANINLGEYLRQREEADHMKWDDDPAGMKIKCVKQIKNSVDSAVKAYFNPEQFEQHVESDISEFAGVLGEKLFPRKKAKQKTGGSGGGSGGGVIRNEKKYIFLTKGTTITSNGTIRMSYQLELKEKIAVTIKTKVSSDVALDADAWKEKIGTNYPLKVNHFVVESKELDGDITAKEENNEIIIEGDTNKLFGTFEVEASDKKLAFVIDCEEKTEDDK